MQSATNSQAAGSSYEMDQDDVEIDEKHYGLETDEEQYGHETDEEQEDKVPFKRTRAAMQLRSKFSVWPVFKASSRTQRTNKKNALMEKINQTKLQETQHNEKEKDVLKCRFCSKVWENESSLKKHERAHTNEKPFKCEKCGKGFSQVSGRNVHQKSVCMKIKSTCPICGALLANAANLSNHLKFTHKMEERLNCDICGISVRSDMKRHVKTKSHLESMQRIQDEAEEQFTISDQARRLKELNQAICMDDFQTDGVD